MTASCPLETFLTKRKGDRRLSRLTHGIALDAGAGLEFGASRNPTLLPDGVKVEYVDYARNESTQVGGTEAVDHVWKGAGSFTAVCGRMDHYDFAIAAHVLQFVPNLLGWLRGTFAVLRPGGVFNLCIPDKRFMFDVRRPTSTLGELVEADLLDFARPSVRQLFNHTHEGAAAESERIWTEDIGPRDIPRFCGEHALALALHQARELVSLDHYFLCHCWVFTPLSFLDTFEEATRLGLFPFVVDRIVNTDAGGFDFYVSLKREPVDDAASLLGRQLDAIEQARDMIERIGRIGRRLGS